MSTVHATVKNKLICKLADLDFAKRLTTHDLSLFNPSIALAESIAYVCFVQDTYKDDVNKLNLNRFKKINHENKLAIPLVCKSSKSYLNPCCIDKFCCNGTHISNTQ
jgi:hypothetical protein